MRQLDAQLLLAWLNLRPSSARILYVVQVIDGKSAGNGILVLPTAVLEHGMEGDDGQLLLQLRLDGFILFLRYLTATALL